MSEIKASSQINIGKLSFPIDLFQQTETPFYAYDTALLDLTLRSIASEAHYGHGMHQPAVKVEYAVKANPNPAILRIIARAGLGADCVSGGEITLALEAGIAAADITYAGVGKTDREIALALDARIGCFNVESVEELEIIDAIAREKGCVAPVALRVNPDIDAHTHHYITTGLAENKFGISLGRLDEAVAAAVAMKGVELKGLHFHIGSQVLSYEPFTLLARKAADIAGKLAARGVELQWLNFGGGLGIDYDDPAASPIADFRAYFEAFRTVAAPETVKEVHFELGRSVVAQCGSLIARVLYVKHGVGKDFVIIDAGMNNLIRPALYQASHRIINLSAIARGETQSAVYDVVGPVCESSDCFARELTMPATQRGDLLAILSAGAYGEAMASNYNSRPSAESLLY